MFRTALCIKMLMILFTRDVVSIKELSEELETNPRNIPEYRKELEAAGYPIETVSGRYIATLFFEKISGESSCLLLTAVLLYNIICIRKGGASCGIQ